MGKSEPIHQVLNSPLLPSSLVEAVCYRKDPSTAAPGLLSLWDGGLFQLSSVARTCRVMGTFSLEFNRIYYHNLFIISNKGDILALALSFFFYFSNYSELDRK